MFNILNEGCLKQIDNKCLICQEGWIQDEFLENCHPICGDGIIQGQEECDDNNLILDDGCFQCKFSCSIFCHQCQFGKCLQCQLNYKLINNICEIINKNNGLEPLDQFYNSNSKLLVYGSYSQVRLRIMKEEFNCIIIKVLSFILYHFFLQNYFANQKPYHISDYNFQTQNILEYYFHYSNRKIIENCLSNLFDECLECQTFYKLSQNKKYCIPKCNDGIVIENEICDDQNNVQFDGCYKCQLSCQLECSQCIQQQCYSCIDGWQIINYRCYQICGDGQLAISSSEQCDDGNYQPYDGCYNCKFECNQNCLQCDISTICVICEEKFMMTEQNQCIPICGDGIIIEGLEECEDLNDIKYDGCYQCLFQCDQQCSNCVQGTCQECIKGYDLIINECQKVLIYDSNENDENEVLDDQKCGDAKQSISEQCDDGNQENGDGCSSRCKTEENWKCNQQQPNSCFMQTKCSLEYLNQTYEHQFVFLSFSKEVKQVSNINFTQSILTEIVNLSYYQYQITINPV